MCGASAADRSTDAELVALRVRHHHEVALDLASIGEVRREAAQHTGTGELHLLDLLLDDAGSLVQGETLVASGRVDVEVDPVLVDLLLPDGPIGRASWRERGGQ